MATIDELVRDFRIAAVEKGEEGGPLDGRLYDRLRTSFHDLRSLGTSGHRAFQALLRDPSPSVRTWVAAQLLAEEDLAALSVLRDLVKEKGAGGLNERITIQEYEAGRLKPPFGEAAA